MLQTQVNYWTLRENERTHKENERILWANQEENVRHNLLTEALGYDTFGENVRHNKVTEHLSQGTLSETHRANRRREKQNQTSIRETRRHNIAMEQNEQRKNQISAENVDVARSSVGAQFANIKLGYSQLGESSRHNMANEGLQGYQNITNRYSYSESKRHNQANESLSKDSNALKKEQNQLERINTSTKQRTLDWDIAKFKDYEYPLKKRETNAEAFRDVTSGFRNITSSAKDVSNILSDWIGKKKKRA